MLDTDTKTKINNARDILVGKVPDPKSQVEQITIALIYKFMDDMDKEGISFGGKALFFTGEYEKYSWSNVYNPKVGGFEMLNLYSEAIIKLNQNPGIPQLFRDIFKNAYLPYRDPETLKMFLKEINAFTYDHSEKLGDAFEYLLSVLGSQGDAGQFRTPRHIIDFIVEILQPKKTESVCDPACGTAGFLISSYKYIVQQNSRKNKGDLLTPDERKKLMQNFTGYDISPDMVRLSLVNMYLHGFTTPKIYEYDTLTSEDKWNEYFDVILANPPFMSPKGGIKPHKKFTIQANRSEVLFVDYIAEHIHPSTGRAGIIVPEGIIFQSANAYKTLRKMLVEKNYLYAVVSLPAGIFHPYSGVKTSILLMDKTLAKKTAQILFVKIDNEGYDLGAQRREIAQNDLPEALKLLQQYKQSLQNNTAFESNNKNVFLVDKERIAAKDEFNLSVDRYRVNENVRQSNFEMVRLNDICEFIGGYAFKSDELLDIKIENSIPVIKIGNLHKAGYIDLSNAQFSKLDASLKRYLIRKDDILIAMTGATVGKVAVSDFDNLFLNQRVGLIRAKQDLLEQGFLKVNLLSEKFYDYCQMTAGGGAQGNISPTNILNFEIPLPPLSIQQQIVNKIESFQKIIDGAKQVVENYKPQIDDDPDWEMVKLGEVCEINPKTILPTEISKNGEFIYLDISSVENGSGIYSLENIIKVSEAPSRARREIKNNDVLLSTVRPNLKAFALLKSIPTNIIASTGFAVLRCKELLIPKFIYELLFIDFIQEQMTSKMGKGSYPSINQTDVENLLIPVPPIALQQQIVSQIEKEQHLVNANKELVKIYEQKIKDEINKLWQAEPKVYAETEEMRNVVAEN